MDNLVCVKITRANDLLSRELSKEFRKQGVSIAASRVLGVLHEKEAQMIGEVADNCSLKQPSVTRAIEQLEENGLVIRKRASKDGRIVKVYLTKEGRNLGEEQLKMVHNLEKRHLSVYSAQERRILNKVLADLITRLKK